MLHARFGPAAPPRPGRCKREYGGQAPLFDRGPAIGQRAAGGGVAGRGRSGQGGGGLKQQGLCGRAATPCSIISAQGGAGTGPRAQTRKPADHVSGKTWNVIKRTENGVPSRSRIRQQFWGTMSSSKPAPRGPMVVNSAPIPRCRVLRLALTSMARRGGAAAG